MFLKEQSCKALLYSASLLIFASTFGVRSGVAQTSSTSLATLSSTGTPANAGVWESNSSTSLEAAGRILNQATFGPVVNDYYTVEAMGITNYVNQQLSVPAYQMPSIIPLAGFGGVGGDCWGWQCEPEGWWWSNVLWGQDQLRERVAYALSKLFVVSMNEVDPRYFPYYLNALSRDAFGNWQTLMRDVALSGAMGTYLNTANSQALASGHDDENFARENMQLFSIGTVALNQDGSNKLDGSGNTIPNYTPAIVQSFAKAFTGYTFANDDCSTPGQPLYYFAEDPPGQACPMVPLNQYHDMSQKTLLRGVTLPAGQSAAADFQAAIANVFNDPSLPPFVSRILIQNLVRSNPSPAYISRIAGVFINDGTGVRGNMTAVIRAILLDSEARADDVVTNADPNGGLLRDPMLWWTSVMRSLGATSSLSFPWVGVYSNQFDVELTNLEEDPHRAGSVFSFYQPSNTISFNGATLLAPEFQLENTMSLSWMILHMQDALDGNFGLSGPSATEFVLNVSATSGLGQIAASQGPAALVNALNALLLHGTMSSAMSSSIVTAVTGLDPGLMVRNAVFLVVTSPQYRVML